MQCLALWTAFWVLRLLLGVAAGLSGGELSLMKPRSSSTTKLRLQQQSTGYRQGSHHNFAGIRGGEGIFPISDVRVSAQKGVQLMQDKLDVLSVV